MLSNSVGAGVPERPHENVPCGHGVGAALAACCPFRLLLARNWTKPKSQGRPPGAGAACTKARGRKARGVSEGRAIGRAGACGEGAHGPGDTRLHVPRARASLGSWKTPVRMCERGSGCSRGSCRPRGPAAGRGGCSWVWSRARAQGREAGLWSPHRTATSPPVE